METSKKKTASSNKTSKPQEATALLRADHKAVSRLFAGYKKAKSGAEKKEIVAQICTQLTVHAQIEEEIFYPAVKSALKDKKLIPEAAVEHSILKSLVAQVESDEPEGEIFDAKIQVMSEYVQHHVEEEQNEIFPKAQATKLDMMELGMQLAERKAELLAEHFNQDNRQDSRKMPHNSSSLMHRRSSDFSVPQYGGNHA